MKQMIVAIAVGFFAFCAVDLRAQTPAAVTQLTSAAYASMKKDDVYVVMFSMSGCGPCVRAKKTLLPALVKKYENVSNVHVYVFPVDADKAASDGTHLYTQLGVSQAPTFVVLYNDTPMFSHSGFSPDSQAKLEAEIDSAVSRVK